jgi:hypothetical protein
MDPIILDNVLPTSFVNELEYTLTSVEFDWHYNSLVSYSDKNLTDKFMKNDSNILDTRGLIHRFYFDNTKSSSYCDFVRPILYFIENIIPVNSLERIRGVLAPRDIYAGKYNVPHIDINTPHQTLIYYVTDSDGGTILFNEKYNGEYDTSKKTIAQEIQAKRGRIVIFDGLQYHTGRIPVSKDKILININFT